MTLRSVIVRLLSVACIVLIHAGVPRGTYLPIYFAFTLGHFALAFFYAHKNIAYIASTPRTYLPMAAILALGAGTAFTFTPPLILMFSIHLGLSDIYTEPPHADTGWTPLTTLRVSRFSLCMTTCLALLRFHPVMAAIPNEIFNPAVGFAAFAFCVALYRARTHLTRRVLTEILVFESIAVATAVVFQGFRVGFDDLVSYHCLYWFFLPLYDRVQRGLASTASYLGTTLAVTGAIFLITRNVNFESPETTTYWADLTDFIAYWHVATSFALSRANPRWMYRLFFPKGIASATP